MAGLQLLLYDEILLVGHALVHLALQVIMALDIRLQPPNLLADGLPQPQHTPGQ